MDMRKFIDRDLIVENLEGWRHALEDIQGKNYKDVISTIDNVVKMIKGMDYVCLFDGIHDKALDNYIEYREQEEL